MDKQKQFLVVDDSNTARSYLKSVLQDAGFKVIEASDGQEALNIIEEGLPDAMVLDLLMPEMDGFEVLEVLKKKNISFPIVVLTADVQDQVRSTI
jgi:CheY-like chemotaxis protein